MGFRSKLGWVYTFDNNLIGAWLLSQIIIFSEDWFIDEF